MEETQALVVSLLDLPPEDRQTKLLATAEQWAGITQVALPDGRIVPVDHTFLVSQLREPSPNLVRLNQLLTTLLKARQSWPPPHHSSADLASLEPILAQSQFQWQPKQPSLLAELWRRFWEFIWDLVSPWLPEEGLISLDESLFPWARYILIGLTSLMLMGVLAFILRELLADLVTESKVDPTLETGPEVLTAEAAFKQAQRLSGDGDYRTAVRYLYLSSLLMLDERKLLRYDRSQTNREYLRSVAHLPKLESILRDVIDVFDRVWYGYRPLNEEDYARYAARVTELRRQK